MTFRIFRPFLSLLNIIRFFNNEQKKLFLFLNSHQQVIQEKTIKINFYFLKRHFFEIMSMVLNCRGLAYLC